MRVRILVLALTGLFTALGLAQAPKPLRIAVTGESNLRTKFIEAMKDAGREVGLSVEVVPKSDEGRTYLVIIAQETSISGAAAAVIALDRDGEVAASDVRSGRLSGGGAMNACAKELAKKFAILVR